MKKISLSILLCSIMYSFALAQDSLKAVQGRFTTELNINPFKGELSLNNALNQIKVRYFVSDDVALRIAVNVNSKKSTTDNSVVYGPNPINAKNVMKSSTIGLNFGFEKHFNGTHRLSPYIGAELSIASKGSSETITNGNSETKIDGAWQSSTLMQYSNGNYYYQYVYDERAYTQYGVNLLAGFDFYVAKHLYLGYEIAFGVSQTKYKDVVITTTPSQGSNSTDPNSTQKDFSIGSNLINGIRLGFVF